MCCNLIIFYNLFIFLNYGRTERLKQDSLKIRHLHALAKSATEEGIELPSLSGRVSNLTAELFTSVLQL